MSSRKNARRKINDNKKYHRVPGAVVNGPGVFESIRYVTLRLDLRLSTVPEWLAVMWRADRELWWCWRCSALLPRPRLPPALTVLIGRPPPVLFLGTTSSWLLHTRTPRVHARLSAYHASWTAYMHTPWRHRGHTHVRHVLQRTSLPYFNLCFILFYLIFLPFLSFRASYNKTFDFSLIFFSYFSEHKGVWSYGKKKCNLRDSFNTFHRVMKLRLL